MLRFSQRRVDELRLGGNPLDVIFEELVGIFLGYSLQLFIRLIFKGFKIDCVRAINERSLLFLLLFFSVYLLYCC